MATDILTVPEMLRHRSEVDGEIKAFTFHDRTGLVSHLTAKDIYTLSGKFAYLMREWGFQSGDVIANGLPNSPERIVTEFGILMAGCVVTNCKVVEKDGGDFWNTARKSKCRAVIVPSRADNPVYQIFSPFLKENNTNNRFHELTIPQAPSIQGVIVCNRTRNDTEESLLGKLRALNDDTIFEAKCSPSDYAILFGTSGHSGFSKLVPTTHEKVINNNLIRGATKSPLYFSDRPMGWVGGFPFDYLVQGSRRILQDKFDNQHTNTPEGLWNIITSAQCIGAAFLPHSILELTEHFQHNPPEYKLVYIGTGGQPLKKEYMKAIGLICRMMVISYGSTEGGITSMGVISDPDEFEDFYCGKVRDEMKLKIIDETGKEVSSGTKGEICLKGKALFKEYYNQDDTSSNPQEEMYTKGGWFRTGDMGVMQADRSLYCYGRKGDIVHIGHNQVFLSWPETILMKCPLILDASVLGIETANNVISLCACVIPKQNLDVTEDKVIAFFNGQLMDAEQEFKLNLYRVFIMDNFPFIPAGKVNKRELKKIVMDKLKLPQT